MKTGKTVRKDTCVAAAYEAGLLGLAGLLAYLFHAPLIFSGLGPTAYEMIETPNRDSARPYNVLVGHSVGIGAALVALWISHGWTAPELSVMEYRWCAY